MNGQVGDGGVEYTCGSLGDRGCHYVLKIGSPYGPMTANIRWFISKNKIHKLHH